MKIANVKINGMTRPMGYAFAGVTVSWQVEDSVSATQKESRVAIATDPEMKSIVSETRGTLSCAGVTLKPDLMPRSTYYVRVSVTGEQGDEADSDITAFDTGKMGEPWRAKWIGPEKDCAFHPEVFTGFAVNKEVRRARLYVTGVGLYEAYLNGEKIGDDVLAPFMNDYNRAIQAQTYEVTGIRQGENRLGILLGNGWYKGRLGYDGDAAVYGDRFAALAELYLEYADGGEDVICTDESWRIVPGDVTFSDIYDGETLDRTAYAGNRPESAAHVVDMSGKTVTDRYSMPLREMEKMPVREIIRTPAGETVLDFGQNFAGYVTFRARNFEPGTRVTLEHGETLQKGNFYHDNYRTAKTLITYISDGREEWVRPRFTYMGFRYVKVTGWPGEPEIGDFMGMAVYSAMERTGWIETGNHKVNRLMENVTWGLKSNFLDMPTDCPQRDERLGWTGDAQVFAPTASFFMDTKAFYRKYLWDMRNDQVLRGGSVANYLPNIHGETGGSAVWADAATFIPDTVYEAFGDKALLAEHYPLMRDWVDWITAGDLRRGEKNLFDFAFTFGDWLAMDGVTDQSVKGGTEDAYIASVYYFASTLKTARAAEILGKAEDAEKYAKLAEKIRAAILNEYFTPAGRLSVDTQTGYVIALRFGIWRDREKLVAGLRDRLRRDGYRIRCGFTGAPLICETLSRSGMHDIAMRMFLREDFPSWLHCVNLGATTIWERWNSLLDDGSISGTGMNSLNHYAYGSIAAFVIRSVAGFTPEEAGYRRVRIEPKPDARLGHMNLRYASASGNYVAEWRICPDGTIALRYEIPFGCEATVVLPESGEERHLTAGNYAWTIHTERDYRNLYSEDSMLEDLTGDPKALEILKKECPKAYEMATGSDAESRTLTFRALKNVFWFGCRAEDVERALASLSVLKAEL